MHLPKLAGADIELDRAQEAARLGPEIPWTQHLLGDALAADGAYGQALRTFHESLKAQPRSAYARRRLVELTQLMSRRSLRSPTVIGTSLLLPAVGALGGIFAKETLDSPLLAMILVIGLGAPAVALYATEAGRRSVDRASSGAWELAARIRLAEKNADRKTLPAERGT